MKKLPILFLVGSCLFISQLIAQIPEGSQVPFFLYRTDDDFFNKKKIYRGEWVQKDGDKITYTIPGNKKKLKFSIKDSIQYWFGYQALGDRWVRVYEGAYSLFGGGTKEAFCILGANSAVFGEDGYVKEVYCTDYCTITYVDNVRKFHTTDIEEFLNSKPDLLQQYWDEKKASDPKAWKKDELSIGIKYLKLFVEKK